MLDIKYISENIELVKENMKKKSRTDLEIVDEAIALDKKYKEVLAESQKLRARRNKVSEEINKAKKEGVDATKLMQEVKEIPKKIAEHDFLLGEIEVKLKKILKSIPNIMHKNVPIGKDDSENVELKRFLEPKKFDFEVKSHQEIATNLGVADFESSAKTSGTGFYYLEGELALLNQALLQFAIKIMVEHGFRYVETPYMLRDTVIKNVTDLNDQENQIYKIDGEELYLIGTSEHSLIGRYIDAQIPKEKLPIMQTSFSMCFRREKGSHGLDERGLFRTHQFNKIEMIVICEPEDSMKFYQKMQDITIEIFTKLGIPIRVLGICSGDLGNLKHIQVDIEAFSPRRNGYFEVGSCSNLTESQARMLGIKAVTKNGEKYVPHTLNNTAIATSRALVAILENFQNADGSITIPDVLAPYMNGLTKIEKKEK